MAYDPQKIINTAHSFLLAADRAMEQRPLGAGQCQLLLVPAVVSTAFAIELYFKAIITLENGTTRGHNLFDLFGHISESSRTKLIAGLQLTQAVFEQKLGTVAAVFVEWRYIFEQQSTNLDFAFLTKLAQTSKQVADAMANPAVNMNAEQ